MAKKSHRLSAVEIQGGKDHLGLGQSEKTTENKRGFKRGLKDERGSESKATEQSSKSNV